MSRLTSLLTPAALALFVTLSACGDGADTASTPEPEAAPTAAEAPAPAAAVPTFAPALEVDLAAMTQTPSGLRYRDVTVGDGPEAVTGVVVSAMYTGWLPDGTEFDSNAGGEPIQFPLGTGYVIPGWDEGLAGMKVGGRRQLVIPPDLGYGPVGSPPAIPPNSYLVFDVELTGVN